MQQGSVASMLHPSLAYVSLSSAAGGFCDYPGGHLQGWVDLSPTHLALFNICGQIRVHMPLMPTSDMG